MCLFTRCSVRASPTFWKEEGRPGNEGEVYVTAACAGVAERQGYHESATIQSVIIRIVCNPNTTRCCGQTTGNWEQRIEESTFPSWEEESRSVTHNKLIPSYFCLKLGCVVFNESWACGNVCVEFFIYNRSFPISRVESCQLTVSLLLTLPPPSISIHGASLCFGLLIMAIPNWSLLFPLHWWIPLCRRLIQGSR